ncbi:putative flavoprotein [Mycobacteroides abscessus subsp. abscessus]|nr:putative flavoprotein [Mycobacteroides abscessus]SII30270.1 putative flavoprotein [Mycobacteroides abscessus subsp. abscessus]CPS29941.1 putative flavoprotein [Mycobacteroides abscessus]CPY25133.1 putative flavoprotein [Mycobacteroides abscessus]CPY26573.1 putative flavoprotein [Mycobacteroides abscessus]
MYPKVSQAISRAIPLDSMCRISFGHRLRFLATPHIPHNWETGLRFDETTATLLCGDLFTHTGQVPALTESVCVAPALAAEVLFHAAGPTTTLALTLEQLAALGPATLASMAVRPRR